MIDVIHIDIPLFIRLLELAREDVKQDADLHDIAEVVIKLSTEGNVASMADYDRIVAFMNKQGKPAMGEGNDPGEYDQEGEMAKGQLTTASDAAEELRSILTSDENLPEWVQAKITKAMDYLDTARDYMKSKEPVDELDRIKQLGGIQ